MKETKTNTSTTTGPFIYSTVKIPFFKKKGQQGSGSMNKNNVPSFFQAKLTIGQPKDKYEKEADTIADAVVNQTTAQPVLQAKNISSIQRNMTNAEFDEWGTNELD